MYLKDLPLADSDRNLLDPQANLGEFIASPAVARLGWPDAVVEDWLYDHGAHEPFRIDYPLLDLSNIQWTLEELPSAELQTIRTGASEQTFLEHVAELHEHWLSLRPLEIRRAWESRGIWLAPPILIARHLLAENEPGYQLVEGRMRMGILQGRQAAGLRVAPTQLVWVGRAAHRAPRTSI